MEKLLKSAAYINGKWIPGKPGKSFAVLNPENLNPISYIPDLGVAETKEAIEAAYQAFQIWRHYTAGKRSRILKTWHKLQLDHLDELSRILTLEQGKPLKESKGEIAYGASFVEWFAEEARRIYGDVIPSHGRDKRIVVLKQPVGVVAAITPWNFPSAMITRKVAPALAAGCTIVLKPAEDTPLSALALAQLAEEAGMPPGVLNVITTTNAKEVGLELCSHPLVSKLSFTGSTEVGKILMQQSSTTLKRLSLELGGNAPFIVFEDADLDAAVEGAIASKYRNAGQTCICSNRIFVQEGIYDQFVKKLTAATELQIVGSGLDHNVTIGPLINREALEKVDRLVKDAVRQGAKIATGGQILEGTGYYYQPTVLVEASENMELHSQEIFGPVAPIYRFRDETEVIAAANNTEYGLAAYFYGRDIARVWRVAEALEYGMIGINTGLISTPVAPFGGMKHSGFGREGSKYGIDDYIEIKYLCMGGIE